MTLTRTIRRAFALTLFCAAALPGCVGMPELGLRPWERDLVARPDMAWDPDPLESTLQGHIHFSKEAAMPGGSAGGGGCGCN